MISIVSLINNRGNYTSSSVSVDGTTRGRGGSIRAFVHLQVVRPANKNDDLSACDTITFEANIPIFASRFAKSPPSKINRKYP